ncbi:MAG: hypothetical protein DWH79_05865 [Planctomycetota bacterium]|nr:MAG: hypothetical protein DWH79_05865 [Planctomycetota bacterium]
MPPSRSVLRLAVLIASVLLFGGAATADDFPRFVVPGEERAMGLLDEFHAHHHARASSDCTLWDGWLPHATLWAAEPPRQHYRASFLRRRIDDEGYVAMQQHRGMAHSNGWPFPAWQQSTGSGWHFSVSGDEWAIQQLGLKALVPPGGFAIEGAAARPAADPLRGMLLDVEADRVSLTTPPFRCGTIVAPFARIEWGAEKLPAGASARLRWQIEGQEGWQPAAGVPLPLPPADGTLAYVDLPLYCQPGYGGLLTGYSIEIDGARGATVALKSVITAIDTRHPITNALFIRGSAETFAWTGDLDFLRRSLPRMRRAARWALEEFDVRHEKHVVVRWVGHDGRTGLEVNPDGTKRLLPGLGVGNNYWDLLPFGGHDSLATIYLTDALARLADLEAAVARHPEWMMPAGQETPPAGGVTDAAFSPVDLRSLVAALKADFQSRFWDPATGRFVGWIDATGQAHDYGFTFVNLEAIASGMATPAQARAIFAWLDGTREIDGDTSRGADIYRWRFAPRATTKRNVETYCWVWSGPESIPWGGQVQDGGAVLGFSYHDLMARLATQGPDDAWQRLRAIIDWYAEVKEEGGYRKYYAPEKGRGTLQGGGPPGGLGIDEEFMESVLVPQVMLDGFLGFEPTAEGCRIAPQLPSSWPELTVTAIRIHDSQVDVTARRDGSVTLRRRTAGTQRLAIEVGETTTTLPPGDGAEVTLGNR